MIAIWFSDKWVNIWIRNEWKGFVTLKLIHSSCLLFSTLDNEPLQIIRIDAYHHYIIIFMDTMIIFILIFIFIFIFIVKLYSKHVTMFRVEAKSFQRFSQDYFPPCEMMMEEKITAREWVLVFGVWIMEIQLFLWTFFFFFYFNLTLNSIGSVIIVIHFHLNAHWNGR